MKDRPDSDLERAGVAEPIDVPPAEPPLSGTVPRERRAVRLSRLIHLGIGLPLACYLLGVVLLGGWVMDDAGVSFAYARNLAAGYGFVSQPGRVPVEGFSNFLWVLVLVPTFLCHVFHPVIAAKVIAVVLFIATLAMECLVMRRRTGVLWPGAMAAVALAVAPPLLIWTASGLENGLLLSLVMLLWMLLILRPRSWSVLSGLVAGLIGLTRPDGLVFAGVVPAMVVAEAILKQESRRGWLRTLVRHVAAFALVVVPFFAFRLFHFGLPWPHPYYAKREWSSGWERLTDLVRHPKAAFLKLWDLGVGIGDHVGVWLLLAGLVAAAVLLFRHRLPRHLGVTALIGGFGAAAYLWLENDWMGEYRFATPVVAMALIFIFATLHAAVPGAAGPLMARYRSAASWVVLAVLLVSFVPRLYRFALRPPTAYSDVSRLFAQRFNAMAQALRIERGSILLADTGAMLMESKLVVYDVAGLFEPAVVQKLKKNTPVWWYEHPEFNDWVFENVKPTFIVTYAFWTAVTGFELDPRFLRDYVAIEAFRDAYVARVYQRDLHSGEFVRRDVLSSTVDLERLKHSFQPPPQSRPLAYRVANLLRFLRHRSATARQAKDEALELMQVRRDPSQAADLLQAFLLRVPDDHEALHLLASALDDAGRAGEARPVWERLLAVAVRDGDRGSAAAAAERLAGFPLASEVARLQRSSTPGTTPEALLQLSLEHYRNQRFSDAIVACRAAIRLRPDFAEAYNNICAAYNGLHMWDQAIEACSKAIELKPDFELAKNNLVWAKQQRAEHRP